MTSHDDLFRRLIELAVQSGRALQNKDTRFIHTGPFISLYDNMLFCLALFRMKTQESIQEAKILLDRLLYFQQLNPQVENFGNFPLYLHDFPYCRDHFFAVQIRKPLFWIQKEFGQVLGDALSKRFRVAYEALSTFVNQLPGRYSLPVTLRFAFATEKIPYEALSPEMLADILTSLQMRSEEPTKEFLEYLAASWHAPSKKYSGPGWNIREDGFEPACTLYDYFLGVLNGGLSKRADKPQLAALQAALIWPFTFTLQAQTSFQNKDTLIRQNEIYGVSLVSHTPARTSPQSLYLLPLYSVTKRHSFVLDLPHGTIEKYTEFDRGIELICYLPPEIYSDNIEKAQAFRFFINKEPDVDIRVDGKKTTAFIHNLPVTLRVEEAIITVQAELIEGDCDLLGHISQANRPLQQMSGQEGQKSCVAFDWQIFWRAVRGSTPLRVKLRISWNYV